MVQCWVRVQLVAEERVKVYVSILVPPLAMSDMDVFAAMGIAGFGKATKKKQLDPSRFDKNKREQVSPGTASGSRQTHNSCGRSLVLL